MANLKWKTKSGRFLFGKSRVYFTCHPDDFDAYFETICDDIFDAPDISCVIWYKEDPNSDWTNNDMEIALKQMRLFVIPVTARFIEENNSARDEELDFAFSHCIPVLPLMQEDGLEDCFNKKCRNLQSLNKKALSEDSTAIPYEKKLNDFLARTLLSNDLSARVHDAFDAHTFMSYRKTDRNYALELMSMIHKNDFCRDIAIWYDEYLIPGEEFTQAIQDAMDESEMFIFVVTPKLMDIPNYVKDKEYPIADKSGKPIFPVEMVSTDVEKLRKIKEFKNIPEPLKIKDEESFSKALSNMVLNLTLKEHKNEAEHLYLIGLAYLNGIYAEVNFEFAVNMIQEAAEEGWVEAMIKLSEMYRRGDGVNQDYEKSALWYNRYAEYWENKYRETEAEEDCLQYCDALDELGHCCVEMGMIDEGKNAFLKLFNMAEEAFSSFGKNIYRKQMINSLINQGATNLMMENFENAKKFNLDSLKLADELLRETGTFEDFRNLAGIYNNLGKISFKEGSYDEALDKYRESMKLREQLYCDSEDEKVQMVLANSYQNMGEAFLVKGDIDKARECYLKSRKINEEISKGNEFLEASINLANIYTALTEIDGEEVFLNELQEAYQKGVESTKKTNLSDERMEIILNIGFGYMDRGMLCFDNKYFAESKVWWIKASCLMIYLYYDTQIVAIGIDQTTIYAHLGMCSFKENQPEEAKVWCQMGIDLCTSLSYKSDNEYLFSNLTNIYDLMGSIYKKENNPKQAKLWFTDSMELRKEFHLDKGTAKTLYDLASSYYLLGTADNNHPDRDMLEEAKKFFLQYVETYPQDDNYGDAINLLQEIQWLLN